MEALPELLGIGRTRGHIEHRLIDDGGSGYECGVRQEVHLPSALDERVLPGTGIVGWRGSGK